MAELEGQYGHLTPQQQEVLDAFLVTMKEIDSEYITSMNLGQLDVDIDGVNTQTFRALRFLRARKFDLPKALEMYKNHVEWRKKHDVDRILQEDKRPSKADLVSKLIPQRHHGYDKQGRPVIIEKVGKIEGKTLQALVKPDEYLQCHIHTMETTMKRCFDSSIKENKNVETFTMVLDLKGIKIDASAGGGYLAMCSENDEQNYPERLGRLVVINPPWIFPVLWKIASPFMDAKTKAKISVLYSGHESTLLELMDPSSLPSEYGGSCSCEGGCVPEYDLNTLNMGDLTPGMENQEVKEETVGAGKKFEEKVVLNPGQTLMWYYRTQSDDVKFTVYTCIGPNEKPLFETVRAQTHQGSYDCEGESIIMKLVWDNSFSYFKGKTVRYSVAVMDR